MEAMQLKEGALLQGGKYRIESVLGQGGFGITYLAEQTDLNRKVAIKEFFMKIHCNRDEGTSHVSVPSVGSRAIVDKFKAKFIKEAQTIAAMENEHIIKIHETFEENGTAYYVMEYINGGSLSDCIPSGGFPEDIALKYIHQIAQTLQYVHEEKHILHLDVKPSNILLRKSDMVVLIDFGISKHYDTAGDAQTSTTPVGVSVGYAPKEQYKLGGVSQFSPATDIYSLGATLYKLLTGQTPPDALDVDERGLSDLPEHISASVRAAVVKATKPQREDRPQSVAEFMALLDAAAKEESNEEDESEEDEIVVQDDQDETEVVVSGHGQTGGQSSGSISSPVPGPAPRKRRLWLWLLLLTLVAGVLAAVVFTGKKADAEQAAAQKATKIAAAKSLEGSANCYIVSSSGSYKFRTVKGNSSTSVGSVASAEVLWESFGTDVEPNVGDLIKSVSYSDGYITFKTADNFKEGNAVIAARDASGEILWSWHIWFTDQPQGQVYYNNAGTMMDRNLGATSATPGDVGALGLLYQWGRKDPFLGSSSISSSTPAKSTITWPSTVSSNSSNGTISYATAHPTTFITYNSSNYDNYDWYYTGSSSTDDTRWTTSDKSKSIYDPCPSGWRVPDGGSNDVWSKALGSSLSFSHTYSSTNKGMNFSGKFGSASIIWYPASAYRNCNDGSLYYVGDFGDYWSASPSSLYASDLNFNSNGYVFLSSYAKRAYGQAVRCVSGLQETDIVADL